MNNKLSLLTAVCGLLLILTHAATAQTASCKSYVSKGSLNMQYERLDDIIKVTDSIFVGDIEVTVNVAHRRIGALVVSLLAGPYGQAGQQALVLKERGLGRLGDNMFMTTFSDRATEAFPVSADAAPFSGVFKPTQRLSFFSEANYLQAGTGGSQGDWMLQIVDVAPNATSRPIALNGWKLLLCPRGVSSGINQQQQQVPSPVPTPVPSPSPALIPAPVPAPIPSPQPVPQPPTNTNTGSPTPVPQPQRNWLGWNVRMGTVTEEDVPSVTEYSPQVQAQDGTNNQYTSGYQTTAPMPEMPSFGNVWNMPPSVNPISVFRDNFNGYLLSRYGDQCSDAACSNIKSKFWKAAILMMYVRSVYDGRIDAESAIQKLRQAIPGPNPLLGKMADATRLFGDKRDTILQQAAIWWDKIQENIAGGMGDLGALMAGASNGPEGLKSLGFDPDIAAASLGPLFGLDDSNEMKALMEGLQEAGFQDLMKEFLFARRRA